MELFYFRMICLEFSQIEKMAAESLETRSNLYLETFSSSDSWGLGGQSLER